MNIKIFLLPTVLCFTVLFGNNLPQIDKNLKQVLETLPSVKGEYTSVEPLADQGGSFINSIYLVKTNADEELILKAENPIWKDKKNIK